MLELSGEADIATVGLLGDELAQMATMNREEVVVDVTNLEFCDVASAHLLLTARRTLPVTLSGATGSVKRVFDLLEALRALRLPRDVSASHPLGELMRPRPGGVTVLCR